MIDVNTLSKLYGEKLLATGSHDQAFKKAVWNAYKAGIAAKGQRLGHISIQTNDMYLSLKFYQELGFKTYWIADAHNQYLTNGTDVLALHSSSLAPRIDHFGLIVDPTSPLLKDKPVETHRDGSMGYYVTTPEGLSLEIITMPTLPEEI